MSSHTTDPKDTFTKDTLTIGLTGGIASGKTTVTNYLSTQTNWLILDADVYARDAVALGSPILQAFSDRYGRQILQPDGTLDRAALGTIIFAQPTERAWVEAQIHPYVRAQTEHDRARHFAQHPEIPVVMAVPLLFEANLTALVDRIWVVSCTPEQQLARLMTRSHLSEPDAQARIAAQMPLSSKCDRADLVLDNALSLKWLYQQLDRAIVQILRVSGSPIDS